MALFIKNLTRRSTPRVPFAKAAEMVLPHWEISLVLVGETRAKQLNVSLRSKTYVPNVLSYKVGAHSGEVIICPALAIKQAPGYLLTAPAFSLLLFIHALLHLKGSRHSATMERRERALMARLLPASRATRTLSTTNGPQNSNRHRHRHLPGQTGRRRGGR